MRTQAHTRTHTYWNAFRKRKTFSLRQTKMWLFPLLKGTNTAVYFRRYKQADGQTEKIIAKFYSHALFRWFVSVIHFRFTASWFLICFFKLHEHLALFSEDVQLCLCFTFAIMFLHADQRKDFQKCKANQITLKLICQVCKLACFNDSLHPNSWNNLKATFFFFPFTASTLRVINEMSQRLIKFSWSVVKREDRRWALNCLFPLNPSVKHC